MGFAPRRTAMSGVIRDIRTQRLRAPLLDGPCAAMPRPATNGGASSPSIFGSGQAREPRLHAVDWSFFARVKPAARRSPPL
jgi:hypothetical protein